MRFNLRLWLTGSLLLCLSACGSNNNTTQPAGNPASQANQSGVVQPASANTKTGAMPDNSVPPPDQKTAATGIDACTLIQTQEVAKIQGRTITEAKSTQRSDGEFLMSQCFYTADKFDESVSLSVFQPNPAYPSKQPKQYFAEQFRNAGKEATEAELERERERDKATAEGRAVPPRGTEKDKRKRDAEPIGNLGDQAFWVETGPTTALYVLKDNQFIILSLGGKAAEQVKLKKTKELAQQALKRLK